MPSVMRVAPTPLYNSFTDVYRFITTLYDIFQNMDGSLSNSYADDASIMAKETIGVTRINHENNNGDDGQGSSISGSDSEADSLGGSTNTL